jgi:hypothetical protein
VVAAVATTFNVCIFPILKQLAAASNNQRELLLVFLESRHLRHSVSINFVSL